MVAGGSGGDIVNGGLGTMPSSRGTSTTSSTAAAGDDTIGGGDGDPDPDPDPVPDPDRSDPIPNPWRGRPRPSSGRNGGRADADVTLKNTGTKAIKGWTVEFDADFEITTLWNAEIVSHEGDHYVIRNINGFWNAKIGAGRWCRTPSGSTASSKMATRRRSRNVVFKGRCSMDSFPLPLRGRGPGGKVARASPTATYPRPPSLRGKENCQSLPRPHLGQFDQHPHGRLHLLQARPLQRRVGVVFARREVRRRQALRRQQ